MRVNFKINIIVIFTTTNITISLSIKKSLGMRFLFIFIVGWMDHCIHSYASQIFFKYDDRYLTLKISVKEVFFL